MITDKPLEQAGHHPAIPPLQLLQALHHLLARPLLAGMTQEALQGIGEGIGRCAPVTAEAVVGGAHDHPVRDEVWDLYRKAVARFDSVPTLIEWDGNIPEWGRLEAESGTARTIRNETLRRTHASG